MGATAFRSAGARPLPLYLAASSSRAGATGLVILAAWLLAGCYQSFKAPDLAGAPAEVQARAELPGCGRVVVNYSGAASDEGAKACFWEAYQARPRRAAEYQFFFSSDAGESISIFRIEQDGSIVIYGNGTPDGWVRQRCGALESYLDDPNMFGAGFGGVDCTTVKLGG